MLKPVVVTCVTLSFLTACGGSSDRSSGTVARGAGGPIASACLSAGRKGASRARCGCVQAVANSALSASDQRKGATFFADPQRAQDIRQSGTSLNSAFWERWKAFGARAAKQCRQV